MSADAISINRTDDLFARRAMAGPGRHAAVFGALEGGDLANILATGSSRSYGLGEVVDVSSTDDASVFAVGGGEVRLYLLSAEGRELTLRTHRAGDVFELGEIGSDLSSEAVAESAANGTVVFALSWSRFLDVIVSRPGAARALILLAREELIRERRLLYDLAFHHVRQRLAHKLAELALEGPQPVIYSSRRELAALVGTRAEEVSRALRRLHEERLVAYRPHTRGIAIVDIEGLASY